MIDNDFHSIPKALSIRTRPQDIGKMTLAELKENSKEIANKNNI